MCLEVGLKYSAWWDLKHISKVWEFRYISKTALPYCDEKLAVNIALSRSFECQLLKFKRKPWVSSPVSERVDNFVFRSDLKWPLPLDSRVPHRIIFNIDTFRAIHGHLRPQNWRVSIRIFKVDFQIILKVTMKSKASIRKMRKNAKPVQIFQNSAIAEF